MADEIDNAVPTRSYGMLPLVGLGGSAGSISVIQEFLKSMPADSGMAFVVILHLSPDHVSTLAEIFQRSTEMPVVTATDRVAVEPNHVYVIPQGKHLSSTDGHLWLTDASTPTGKRVAVDVFFRTLADTHGPRSVAIVLSGADGDGAIGIKRIKERGGLTIAQDPDEAEHSGMPRSAIATGMVDWVLKVGEMPARLQAYRERGEGLKLPTEDGPHPTQVSVPPSNEAEAALRDILAFLHTKTGCDFSYYKRATILRRVARRMQVNGLEDLPGYLIHLRMHTGEAGALLQDLLISVTNFFRDREAFEALERQIPALFKDKGPGDTVRVWVAACATGEEAYSIAMLLCEHARTLEAPPQLQVFATDLDDEVIRNAREGFYPETIMADVSEDRLRRFFVHEPRGYRVRREVREIVLFAPHDLLKDSPFSRLDLVTCRNLLIYLNRDAQKRAWEIFHFALKPGGLLFLGSSETVEDGSALFAVSDKKHRIYIQRPGPRRALSVPPGSSTLARALDLQERSRERPSLPRQVSVEGVTPEPRQSAAELLLASGLSTSDLHYRFIERLSPPSILVNAGHEIVHVSETAGRFLQYPGGEPSRNLLRTVHPSLRIELRAALYAAAQSRQPATAHGVAFEPGGVQNVVDLRVSPADDLAPDFLLVVFMEHSAGEHGLPGVVRSVEVDQVSRHLEIALETTKTQLRETIEQSEASTEELKASNEELQAINEELRSATEELETSREELHSVNEELTSVNQELTGKVTELAHSNSDLQNLMAATDIATIFLDRELRITRFTPSSVELFNLIATDIGRPLTDLANQLEYPEIVPDAANALKHLRPAQREVRSGGRWFLARTLPYRTIDDRIAGVVLTFTDITTSKQAEMATARLAALVESSIDAIVGKDLRGIVTSWNSGAEKIFGYTAAEMIGRSLTCLIPVERQAEEGEILEKIAAGETVKSFETVRLRKDGKHIPVSVTVSPIKDAAGRIVGGSKIARDISEAKEAEQELRTREEEFRSLADAVPQVVWSTRPDGLTSYLNQRWVDYTGLSLEESYGHGWLAPFHPEDKPAAAAAWQRAVETEGEYSIECRLRRADGVYRWWLIRGEPRRDAKGQIQKWFGTCTDIEELKGAEESMRLAHQRLQTVLNSITDGLAVLDKDWRYTYVNDQAAHLIGMSREELLGGCVWELFPQTKGTQFEEGFHRAMATGQRVELVEYYPEPINKWLECYGYPSSEGLSIYFHDVTVRKQAEAMFRQNAGLFTTLIEQAPLGVYVVDGQFRMQQVNSLAEPVFSKVRPLIGREFTEVMETFWGAEVGGEVARIFRHTLDTGERYISPSFVHPRADLGVEQAYDWETKRVTLPDGEYGLVCYFNDVTERRRTEAALQAAKEAAETANESKDRFLAVLSHELRTPLTPVLMTVTALEHDPDLRPDVREELAMIKRNVELETKLIDDLLDLSRITSGKVELKTEAVDLKEAVEHVCGMCRPQFVDHGVRLETEFGDEPCHISADPARLQQVLWNVIKNAIKFTPRQGVVHVRTARLSPERCEVRVVDTGIGIPADVLPRIFDAFEQGEVHITRQFGGLGLGLAISSALIGLHGGTIRAESAGQGKGATFIVELPGEPALPANLSVAAAPIGTGTAHIRVLLVEDHADTARTLARLLRKNGFEVVATADVASAVAAADHDVFEVLVSDLGLPDGDGYQVMRSVRARRIIPGIAMSGYGMEEDITRSREAGFTEHLVKPINVPQLIDAIRRVTDRG